MIEIELQDRYFLVSQGGRVVGAFPAHDREALGDFIRAITGRELAEAGTGEDDRPAATPSPQEAGGGEADRTRGQPHGEDGASCWPSWGVDWIWTPTGAEDPEILAN